MTRKIIFKNYKSVVLPLTRFNS